MNNILTDEFAKELNGLHGCLQKEARLLVSQALLIGEKLTNAEKISDPDQLRIWLDSGILTFTRRTAYNYIFLFTYKAQIKDAENLSKAYEIVADLRAEKKQIENKQAADRVQEYLETGKKPEGWRQHTDDKLAEKMENGNVSDFQSGGKSKDKSAQVAAVQIEQEWQKLYKMLKKSNAPHVNQFMGSLNSMPIHYKFNELKTMQEWCSKFLEIWL